MKIWQSIRKKPLPTRLPGSLVVRNAISNFVVIGWLSGLSILSIPIYVGLLGATQWGIATACLSLQLLFNFLDSGLGQLLPRWVAKELDDRAVLLSRLALFRRVYFSLALLGFLLLQLGAHYLAHAWFQAPPEKAGELETAIRIIAFQMMFQLGNNFHTGLWHGLQMQVLSNLRACVFGTLKHGVTIAILMLAPAQAWVYATSFAIVAMLEWLANAFTVRRTLGPLPRADAGNATQTRAFLREAAMLSGGVLIGLLVSQLDRLILSRVLTVEAFGIYIVVANLALAFLQLQAPLTRAYFPLLVQDVQASGRVSMERFGRLLIGNFVSAVVPTLLVCIFARQVLELWIRDPDFVVLGHAPFRLLLLAVAINALYNCIYQIIVASGCIHLVLWFNSVTLVVASGVVAVLGMSSGLLLGGAIWLSTTLTQFALGLAWFILHRRRCGPALLGG